MVQFGFMVIFDIQTNVISPLKRNSIQPNGSQWALNVEEFLAPCMRKLKPWFMIIGKL